METCEIYDVGCWFDWLFKEIELFFVWILGTVLDAVAGIFSLLPVPDFMQNVQSYTLPDSMAYYASAFEIPFGVGVIVSAYGIRFLIRRLPVVG